MTEGPRTLIYSDHPRPDEWAEWLSANGLPGTMVMASTIDEAKRLVGDVEVVLCRRVPPDLFQGARKLRWVQSINAGIEDLVVAELPDGVVATRVVDQFGGPIAEYVFAELLARVRELDRTRRQQAERRWEHFIAGTLVGKILGVAGLGSIGGEIVRKGRAFDMPVYGLSRSQEHTSIVDRHFTPDRWTDFVRELDVLVLTLPFTPQTDGVVDATVLEAMNRDAILVNVGRGRVVKEADLIRALQEGLIGGAILDVFEKEPLAPESPLWDLPGVTVTPHISGPSTVEGVGSLFLENMRRYLDGQELLGVVNRKRGY